MNQRNKLDVVTASPVLHRAVGGDIGLVMSDETLTRFRELQRQAMEIGLADNTDSFVRCLLHVWDDRSPNEPTSEALLTVPAPTGDAVNHPAHYGGADDPYEAIKVIEAWELGFNTGNTVKYIARAGKKDDSLQDLKKARWYLEREIKKLEGLL